MASQTTKLSISPREPEGSRATRRLRRSGRVPGILYGGDAEPLTFSVDARELRHALHAAGAVLELAVGGETQPIIRIVEVLPAPLGPRKPTTSPGVTSNEMASTATTSLVWRRKREPTDARRPDSRSGTS